MSKQYWWTNPGAKYGELTVIEAVYEHRPVFRAQCSCGRIVEKYGPNLARDKSCGHLNMGHPNYIKQSSHERFGVK